jgi:hypothetical protein
MKKNNFKSLMQAAVLICTPLVIASCDDVFGDADNPIPSYMSIKEAAVDLVLHADKPDSATYTRTAIAATGAEIVYSSSDEKVATVDAKTGKITAVGEGECEIIAEATGKDSHGNMTYQPQKSSFTVRVKDYRARIALKEGVEIPVFNSAQKIKPIDMKELVDVWPAFGTTGLNVAYGYKVKKGTDPIGSITSDKINLSGSVGIAKLAAKINTPLPTGFEAKSFPKAQETDSITIEVKQGVAYISSYDAKGVPDTTYMFKDYKGEKYINLSDTLKTTDVYLGAGWYYLDKDITFKHNIRITGDVNIILGAGCDLTMSTTGTSILDQSAKKTHKLNIYAEPATTKGTITANAIQDFKEVNILGCTVNSDITAVENVNITKGTAQNLNGTGTANIIDGAAGFIFGFETATIAGGTVNGNLNVVTATITDGTVTAGAISATALNIEGGEVTVDNNIALGKNGAGKLTMTGGELTVGGKLSGNTYAVNGSVEVTKGDFTASSQDYHAVSGTLTGKFYGKTTAAGDWAEIKDTESSDPYITTVEPKKP